MATDRFKLTPLKNLKEGFTKKENLIDDGSAFITAGWYALVPTLLGLSGWVAWLVGWVVPYFVGKLVKAPGMCSSAIGIATVHVVYATLSDPNGGATNGTLNKLFGKPLWDFNAPKASTPPATTLPNNQATVPITLPPVTTNYADGQYTAPPTVDGLSDTYVLPTGETIEAYSPSYVEQQAQQNGIDGIVGNNYEKQVIGGSLFNGRNLKKGKRNPFALAA